MRYIIDPRPRYDHSACVETDHDRAAPDASNPDANLQALDSDGLLACNDDGLPMFYCLNSGNYHHLDPEAAPCFLIREAADAPADPGRRLARAVQKGIDAFWGEVAAMYPEATSGDMDPISMLHFEQAATGIVRLWLEYNAAVAEEEAAEPSA